MSELTRQINRLKNSISGHKGHLTRIYADAEVVDKESIASPAEFRAVLLEKHIVKVTDHYDAIGERYLELQDLDPDSYDQHEQEFTEVHTGYQDACKQLRAAIDRIRASASARLPAPAPDAAAAAAHVAVPVQPVGRGKINETLKPPQLTGDFTPVELRAWVKKLRAFWSSSSLDKYSVEEQQAHFRVLVSDKLFIRIEPKVAETTEIFSDDGCLSLIQEEFMRKERRKRQHSKIRN